MSGCPRVGKSEHCARITRLIVLGDKFDLFAEHTARFVHARSSAIFAPISAYLPKYGGRPADGQRHADLDRITTLAPSNAGERGRRRRVAGESQVSVGPSRPASYGPPADIALSDWFRRTHRRMAAACARRCHDRLHRCAALEAATTSILVRSREPAVVDDICDLNCRHGGPPGVKQVSTKPARAARFIYRE